MLTKKCKNDIVKIIADLEFIDIVDIDNLLYLGNNTISDDGNSHYFATMTNAIIPQHMPIKFYCFNLLKRECATYCPKLIIGKNHNHNFIFNMVAFEHDCEVPISILYGKILPVIEAKLTKIITYNKDQIDVVKRWKFGDYVICAGTKTHVKDDISEKYPIYTVSKNSVIISGFYDISLDYAITETNVTAYTNEQNVFIISNKSWIIAIHKTEAIK